MKWIIVAPFIKTDGPGWLGRYVPGDRHSYRTVGAHHAHDRSRAKTDASGWADHFKHAWRAMRLAHAQGGTGMVTCFPQLAVACGLISRLFRPRIPIIAWTFNIGALPTGLKRRLSAFALKRVDAVIVHSVAEIEECAACFALPREKIVFVPLQRVVAEPVAQEEAAEPYMLAMGSANRDYRLLFDVLRRAPVRTVVIAGPHAVHGLDIPACVEVRSGLTLAQCHAALQGARVSVIPVANATTASGQVTLLDSMGMGRATIVTRCPGSVDYVVDGETALLVAPGDRDDLARAIARLWEDDAYRARLGEQGREHVRKNYSDAAIAAVLGRICDAIEDGRAPASVKA